MVAQYLSTTVADQAQAGKREFTRGEAIMRFTFTETAPGRLRSLAEVLPGVMGFPAAHTVCRPRPGALPTDVSACLGLRYQPSGRTSSRRSGC